MINSVQFIELIFGGLFLFLVALAVFLFAILLIINFFEHISSRIKAFKRQFATRDDLLELVEINNKRFEIADRIVKHYVSQVHFNLDSDISDEEKDYFLESSNETLNELYKEYDDLAQWSRMFVKKQKGDFD